MTDLHQLGVTSSEQIDIEKVDPQFINEGLIRARVKTAFLSKLANFHDCKIFGHLDIESS